ncbi:MAG TPA: ABC transporter ATP-binding protein [Actinomycetota bacterium]|nr:ABC transporter ATP-binding protein [Actinomycetota bacterium]
MYEQDMGAPPTDVEVGTTKHSGPVALEIEGLSRSFQGRTIVTRFDLSLDIGERVALRGPNGSGKTTILRCIAGTLAPSHGTVRVGGHTAGTFEAREMVGPSLSLERSFYRRLSGRENLMFFARLRHVSKRHALEDVAGIEQELQLTEILNRRVDRCSTGMLQQLAVARALLGDPHILLLDEPTRSLDTDAVERIWAAVDRRACAVVIASHVPADIERCERVYDLPT